MNRNVALARQNAVEKRKETIGAEYKNRHKVNSFVDKRFGENDKALSNEEKMLMRFAKQRATAAKRKGHFNLGESNTDVLTHGGATIDDNFDYGYAEEIEQEDFDAVLNEDKV